MAQFTVTNRVALPAGSLGRGEKVVTFTIRGNTGEITFEAETDNTRSGTVRATPLTNMEQFSQFITAINEQLSGVRSAVSSLPNDFISGRLGRSDLPGDILSEKAENIEAGGDFSVTVNFPPVKIPVTEGSDFDTDQITDFPVEFVLQESSDTPFISGDRFEQFMLIPSHAFVETVDLSGFDCGTIHDNFFSDFDEVEGEIVDADSSAIGIQDTLMRARNNILENIGKDTGSSQVLPITGSGSTGNSNYSVDGGKHPLISAGIDGGGVSPVQGNLQDLSPDDLLSLGQSILSGIEEDVGGTDLSRINIDTPQTRVDELRDRISSADTGGCTGELTERLDSLQSAISDLSSIKSQLRDLKESLNNLVTGKDVGNCGSVYSGFESQITDIEGTVGSGDFKPNLSLPIIDQTFQDTLSMLESVREDMQDELDRDSPCYDQFTSRLRSAESTLRNLERETTETPRLTCGDIPNEIKTPTEQFMSSASTWTNRDLFSRLPDRKSELVEEGEEMINRVESNVDDENPCKSDLLSRARSSLSELRSAGTRPETAVPCEERFSDTGQQLEQFENRILNLSAPVGPQQIQEITSQGRELIESIESNISSEDACRREMINQAEGLISRAEGLTARVRIETGVEEEVQQQRDKLIEQLTGDLQGLRDTEDS